jgi:hypothetical protein
MSAKGVVENCVDESEQLRCANSRKYCLFDTSVLVPYFLPHSHKEAKVHERAVAIIESVRSKASEHFFYIPNFCIAEVFSTFAKHAYGDWNKQVSSGTIDGRVHASLRKQFQDDIHNAALFYHYELSRYHVLTVNIVAPVDHYFKLGRGDGRRIVPSGTFDQLIAAMGIHLTKIHGAGNVVVVTADNRLAKLIRKCRSPISATARKTMKIADAERFVGIPFQADSFPLVLDLATAKDRDLQAVFGEWPLPVAGRYKRPCHLKRKRAAPPREKTKD